MKPEPVMKPLAVVIDDEASWQDKIRKRLEPKFEVICEEDGDAGLAAMRRKPPALLVLDENIDGSKLQGHDVLIQLRADPALERVPVLMVTHGAIADSAFKWMADEHVKKKVDFEQQFDARVERLLARAAQWPFESLSEPTVSLVMRDGAPVDMMIGVIEYHAQTHDPVGLDFNQLKAHGRVAHVGAWQSSARMIGSQLYRALVKHPEIHSAIEGAITRFRRVNIAGTLDLLEVPLELMLDQSGREYLVLYYPFSRSVIDVRAPRGYVPPISPKFLNDLHRRGLPLRVLLIASNTGGIPKVDKEVRDIYRLFKTNPKGLRTDVKVLKTADATLSAVSQELESGGYHIVHYAGHGEFVTKPVLDQGLVLKRTRDRPRPEDSLSGAVLDASQLRMLWRGGQPNLFYSSACRSASVRDARELFNNDLLGLVEAAISAGVPSVIGFRWPVSDHGAYELATVFYSELLTTGRPDQALRVARAKLYFKDHDDPAWLSSVLIMQPP